MNIIFKKLKILVFVYLVISGCNGKSDTDNKKPDDPLLGKKLNFMHHAVLPHNIDSCSIIPDMESPYKIVTYVNSYCHYCWEAIWLWKEHINDFIVHPQVSFFCYVHASPDDFDEKNNEANVEFPVYLDLNERFRIVNGLGNSPNRQTFLLNEKNEIILIGQPFTPEVKEKYLEIITAKESNKYKGEKKK